MTTKTPTLSNEQFLDLLDKAQHGDIDARNAIVMANMGLVRMILRRYAKAADRYADDMFQDGIFGLMDSIQAYHPKLSKFSTYASYWIRKYMMRSLTKCRNTIKVPEYVLDLQRKIAKLAPSGETTMSVEQIARALGVTAKAVSYVLKLRKPIDIASAVHKDDSLMACANDQESILVMQETRAALGKAIGRASLSNQELAVTIGCFGLNGTAELSSRALGSKLGLRPACVRASRSRALQKLRLTITSEQEELRA